jgi:uncharacterized protein (DUF2252 family)
MSDWALRDRIIDLEVPENDRERGRGLRRSNPRAALAQLNPSSRSATEILVAQNADRIPNLVPLRFARMLTDPFSFYRGSAAVMAADLAAGLSSGINVLCCGDAHLSNFGIYAAPHRALVFDVNDFDQAAVAPWEWDVKRLVTSAIVGGQHAGYETKVLRTLVEGAAKAYQDALSAILDLDVLDRYYLRFEPELYRDRARKCMQSVIDRALRQARQRTSAEVFSRIMTVGAGGNLQLVDNPPVLQHVDVDVETQLVESVSEYLTAVPADVAMVLSHFRVTDLALRVVGVGSVGTRCYLAILTGPDGTPLVLQLKEARTSVLEEYGGIEQPQVVRDAIAAFGQGARVVDSQRVLQAMSDVLLGTARKDGRDYYIRQFHDMKGSIETDGMSPDAFGDYVSACSILLARAHAQSANASMLRGYVGDGDTVRKAIVDWSHAYAEKALDDFHQLLAAAKAGEIEVADDPAR